MTVNVTSNGILRIAESWVATGAGQTHEYVNNSVLSVVARCTEFADYGDWGYDPGGWAASYVVDITVKDARYTMVNPSVAHLEAGDGGIEGDISVSTLNIDLSRPYTNMPIHDDITGSGLLVASNNLLVRDG